MFHGFLNADSGTSSDIGTYKCTIFYMDMESFCKYAKEQFEVMVKEDPKMAEMSPSHFKKTIPPHDMMQFQKNKTTSEQTLQGLFFDKITVFSFVPVLSLNVREVFDRREIEMKLPYSPPLSPDDSDSVTASTSSSYAQVVEYQSLGRFIGWGEIIHLEAYAIGGPLSNLTLVHHILLS